MIVANYDIRRILVDNRSSTNILFCDTFLKIRLPSDQLKQINAPLTGFSRDLIIVEGEVTLLVIAGQSL